MEYTVEVSEYAYLMEVREFIHQCENGSLIDYDGMGLPVKGGLEAEGFWVYPSVRQTIPEDATHIAWYSK